MFDELARDVVRFFSRSDIPKARWILRRCMTLEERLNTQGSTLEQSQKEDITRALSLSQIALQKIRDGFKYNTSNPNDPVRAAVNAIDKCFPGEPSIELPDDNDRIQSLAAAAETLNRNAGNSVSGVPLTIRVSICSRTPNTPSAVVEETQYTLSEANGYTLDDLFFVVRLRRTAQFTNYPYFYSRPTNQHVFTHEGSKFEFKRPSQPLRGLPRASSADEVGVYLVVSDQKFLLLVKGVPRHVEQKDELHIINRLDSLITADLRGDQTRTFNHHSKSSWHSFPPSKGCELTWKHLKAKAYEGEWIVCVD